MKRKGPAPKVPDEVILALLARGWSLYTVALVLGIDSGNLYRRACVRDRRRFRPNETQRQPHMGGAR